MSELSVTIKPVLDKTAARRMQGQLSTPTAMRGGGAGAGRSPLLGEKGFGGLIKQQALTLAALGAIGVGVGMVVKRFAQASPALAGVLDLMRTAINMILEPMGREVAKHLWPLAKNMIQLATDFRQTFTNEGMSAALDGLYKGVMFGIADGFGITFVLEQMFASIGRSLDGMSSFFGTAVTDLQRIGKDIANLPRNIWDGMSSFFGTAVTDLQRIGKDIWDGMSSFFGTAVTDLQRIGKDIANLLRNIWNAIKGTVPSVPSIPSGNDVLGGIIGGIQGMVPKFADGGVVTKPTLGITGEAGPEAIIPLDKLQTGMTVVFNGNVYGMNDFEGQVKSIVDRYGNRRNYA